jgi:NAD(P)-dependent dehydrogenase (short-subunit alcohol dehydrogenase family)
MNERPFTLTQIRKRSPGPGLSTGVFHLRGACQAPVGLTYAIRYTIIACLEEGPGRCQREMHHARRVLTSQCRQIVMRDFAGKRVLVTGGGRGLGLAMASEMARHGARVALAGRTTAQLHDAVTQLEASGAIAHALPVDLYDVEQARQLVGRAADAMGGVDVLVNNAGGWGTVPGAAGPILDATVEGYDSVFALNLRSPLFASIEAARLMIQQGTGGCILFIASVDGLAPAPTEALYGAAKSAVLSLTETLAYEFGSHGIRVNAIAPGIIETEMTRPWLADPDDRTDRESFYPLGRIGQPADIAAAALYLCSSDAAWVSGVTLPVCGGQYGTSDIFRWTRAHNSVPASKRI